MTRHPRLGKKSFFLSESLMVVFHMIVLVTIFTLCTKPAEARTQDTLKVAMEPVVVKATHSVVALDKASMSVTAFRRTSEDMNVRRASSMDELTLTIPGIWVSNRENPALGERMTVRGLGWRSPFGVRGVQVILDDIPLTVADGQTVLNMVDPAMVHSIEVLRGPSATFWGNSSGGVLYMRTQPRADDPWFRYRSYGGSYGTYKQEAQFYRRIGGIQWNAYGSYYRTDGFRDHSDTRQIRAGISAGFDMGANTRVETRIAYSGMPKGYHPGSLLREEARENPSMARQNFVDIGAGKEFHQLMAGLSLYQSFDSGLLTVTTHGIYRDLENPRPFGYPKMKRNGGGARATFDIDNLPFELQIGSEAKWQSDERQQYNIVEGKPGDILAVNQLENVSNLALFVQAIIPLNRFHVNLGARADHMVFGVDDRIENEDGRRSFTAFNPSVGITYELTRSIIYANVSTSFESPTTTEFKNRPGGGTGLNLELNPERTLGTEVGTRGSVTFLPLEYDVALFANFVSNQIEQVSFHDGQSFYVNGGSADHYGIETYVRLQPMQNISLEIMYTWLHAVFSDVAEDNYKNNRLPGLAPHRLGAQGTIQMGRHYFGMDAEWVSDYYADSGNSSMNEAYYLINARWLFTLFEGANWKVQPFASVYNILNRRYNTSVAINSVNGRYFEPGSDRSIQGGFSINFK